MQLAVSNQLLGEARIRFHYVAAACAGTLGFAAVELLEVRQKVRFNIVQLKVCGVQGLVAGLAEPQESVCESLSSALALYDQADAAGLLSKSYKAGAGAFRTDINLGPTDKLGEQFSKVKQELADLQNPVNQIIAGAEAIGTAFGESFKGLVSGSMTAKEAMANFFQGVANHFIDMASQMIAKWLEMQILGLAQGLLGGLAGGVTGGAASGGFALPGGSGFAGGFSMPPMFSGGGYTGDGSRSGGVDGQGGFPAILHPGETVVDHRRGDSGMGEAMRRWNTGNGSLREQMAAEGAGGAGGGGVSPVTLNVTATRIADDNWVKVNDLQVALAETRRQAAKEGATMGMAKTISKLQQSPGTRRRLGM